MDVLVSAAISIEELGDLLQRESTAAYNVATEHMECGLGLSGNSSIKVELGNLFLSCLIYCDIMPLRESRRTVRRPFQRVGIGTGINADEWEIIGLPSFPEGVLYDKSEATW